MTPALARWNRLPDGPAAEEMLSICGSRTWARCVAGRRPLADEKGILEAAAACWDTLASSDREEAFAVHPQIGDRRAAGLAAAEQSGTRETNGETLSALEEANRDYEQRFRRVFLVCATGKTAEEMLALCRERLHNDPRVELAISSEEQKKITALRLKRWLAV